MPGLLRFSKVSEGPASPLGGTARTPFALCNSAGQVGRSLNATVPHRVHHVDVGRERTKDSATKTNRTSACCALAGIATPPDLTPGRYNCPVISCGCTGRWSSPTKPDRSSTSFPHGSDQP
jgi:hypothetical protein